MARRVYEEIIREIPKVIPAAIFKEIVIEFIDKISWRIPKGII